MTENANGSGGNHADSERDYSLAPVRQADLIGAFTTFSTAAYSLLGLLKNDEIVPPLNFYVTFVILYLVFWVSFYFPLVRTVPVLLRRAATAFGDLITRTSVPVVRPPHEQGNILRPVAYLRPDETRWPLSHSLRVQGLAISAVLMAGWLTLYSNGPFLSPYSQVLIALALMSPNVASSAVSIAWTYMLTATSILIFQLGFQARQVDLGVNWYIATTMVVFALSGLVSWITRARQEEVIAGTGGATNSR